MTSVATAHVLTALTDYAVRFHTATDKEHHVVSPLGAWTLLAVCAIGSEGRLRDQLTRILGVDVDTASAFAGTLLDTRHEAANLAAGVWIGRDVPATAATWLARLPSAVDRGPVPDRAALDAWAKAHTKGLVEHFPAPVTPLTMLVLATALATEVSWLKPFITVSANPAVLAGSTMWSGSVERVLQTPASPWHHAFIAATERAGDVGVHVAEAAGGLSVTSVIADRSVPRSDVISMAHEIACGRYVPRRSLFDLPLGDSPVWRIVEQPGLTTSPDGRDEQCEAVLPAWRADGQHDLSRPELGFPAVAAALETLLGSADLPSQAAQAVVARYGRTGFSAAAVSAFAMFGAMPRTPQQGVRRTATLRFGHPFAVVAATDDSHRADGRNHYGPWHRLPVYSAWVAEPTEADAEIAQAHDMSTQPHDVSIEPQDASTEGAEPGETTWRRVLGRIRRSVWST